MIARGRAIVRRRGVKKVGGTIVWNFLEVEFIITRRKRLKFAAGGTAVISVEIKEFPTPSLGITRQSAFVRAEEREKFGKKALG